MAIPSFEELLNSILDDYRNQLPYADTSEGTLIFIKSAVLAAAMWGIYKFGNYCTDQIFADTSDSATLDHHCFIRALTRNQDESDSEFLARYLDLVRTPPTGGKAIDYERWANSVILTGAVLHNPTAAMLSVSGFSSFTAANCIDSDLNTLGWSVSGSALGSYLQIDCGISNETDYTGLRIYADDEGALGTYKVQYSDGAAWSDAVPAFTPDGLSDNHIPWDSVGAHRYWRLTLISVAGTGPGVYGMEWEVGDEHVETSYCKPINRGPGTVDVLIISNVGNGIPSAALLAAVLTKVELERPVTAKSSEILSPTVSVQNLAVTYAGSIDAGTFTTEVSAYLLGLAPGETLFTSKIESIAITNGADGATCTTPASDVVLGSTSHLVSGTVTLLSA